MISSYRLPSGTKIVVITALVGLGAGIGGMSLALLLHAVQHIAYGYSLDTLVGRESFLEGVTAASPERRLIVLSVAGVIAGIGWWCLYRYGKPLMSIRKAVIADDPRMPVISTITHVVLQIVTVAMGSPLGREVAPREIAALWAGWLSHYAGLTPAQARVMVACGAGAGLAAVYNVPLGGAVYVLEVLLCTFEWSIAATAFATSAIAAIVAWIGLGDGQQYQLPVLVFNAQIVVWAVITGPLFGAAAWAFVKVTSAAREAAPRGNALPLLTIINFIVVGLLAMAYPQLVGNGRGAAGLSFDNDVTVGLACVLLVLKVIVEVSTLRAGAEGGLLTPGLTNGALLAVILGGIWNMIWPGTTLGAFAVVGAASFLGASMQMPVTAIVLMMEFTRFSQEFLIPTALGIAGSVVTYRAVEAYVSRASALPGEPTNGVDGITP
ncbi:chloride channel protein [Caballeronia sp. BR00000012568055]|uniref:chloride channel protein n=1 Tax=Caballeronia sp. BR00000012568055 TaxID=2918761 RepID=UPI0023F79699|nr:chloride channel protein [Caballeronia sp. BR00000012568055]